MNIRSYSRCCLSLIFKSYPPSVYPFLCYSFFKLQNTAGSQRRPIAGRISQCRSLSLQCSHVPTPGPSPGQCLCKLRGVVTFHFRSPFSPPFLNELNQINFIQSHLFLIVSPFALHRNHEIKLIYTIISCKEHVLQCSTF